jgi:hypothetical protein
MRQATTQFRRERLKLAKMPDPILYKNIFLLPKILEQKLKILKNHCTTLGNFVHIAMFFQSDELPPAVPPLEDTETFIPIADRPTRENIRGESHFKRSFY